jgi:hypothetical protein|tara:strand:- start:11009 stop:11800 length:792 start_codon:yes stop_codon:yes gene_type:complete
MGFVSPRGIARRAAYAAAAAMTLIGIPFSVTKLTPTGPSTGTPIVEFRTSSGAAGISTGTTVLYVDEPGNLVASGSLTTQANKNCSLVITTSSGTIICGTGTPFVQADTDARYVLEQGDTMSGALLMSGGTVDVQASPVIFPLIASGTSLATGAILQSFDMPFGGKFLWMHCTVDNPATDGLTEIDIKVAGTSITSTNITIDALEPDSDSAATAPVIDIANNSFSQGDQLLFSTPTVGGGTLVANGLNCRGVVRRTNVSLTQP